MAEDATSTEAKGRILGTGGQYVRKGITGLKILRPTKGIMQWETDMYLIEMAERGDYSAVVKIYEYKDVEDDKGEHVWGWRGLKPYFEFGDRSLATVTALSIVRSLGMREEVLLSAGAADTIIRAVGDHVESLPGSERESEKEGESDGV